MTVFSQLHGSLQQVLDQRLQWTEIREVQEQACSAISGGDDVLVIAPTAGGKSEAALIPVTDDILKHGRQGVCCLYISPLKALINDQEERFAAFCNPTSLSVMKWHGDVSKGDRAWKDGEPPHFLMITPESLEVVLQEKELLHDLSRVRSVIIDELHAFVESERGVHLRVLLHRIDRLANRNVQRIGLSATTGNPEEVLAWLSEGRHGSRLVAVPAPRKEKQFLFIVEEDEGRRIDALVNIVAGRKALVFVNSRGDAEKIMQACGGRVRNLHIHHSSLSPAMRKTAEEAFDSGEGACIICTSTLELGIDIGDLDIVVQAGPPDTVSSFLQRMGRSGRRGKAAFIAWLLKDPLELLVSTAIIECAMKRDVEDLVPQELPYNVLLQQLLLTLHTRPRITRRQLAAAVLTPPVFATIPRAAFDRIVSQLIATGFITQDGEVLMPGGEADRLFLRSNGRDLYSVIAGGGEYRAVTPDGEEVGRLDARFVNSRDATGISLGGKEWSMVKCDENRDLVVVVPSSSSGTTGTRVFWTGGEEAALSPLISRAIRGICFRGGSVLPLGGNEQALLATALKQFPELTEEVDGAGLQLVRREGARGKEIAILTFQGSRFNRILGLLLSKHLGGKARIRYNDFLVTVPHPAKEDWGPDVVTALEDIRGAGRKGVAPALPLPPRENWKFAGALPDDLFREMVMADYYHTGAFFSVMEGLRITGPEPDGPGKVLNKRE